MCNKYMYSRVFDSIVVYIYTYITRMSIYILTSNVNFSLLQSALAPNRLICCVI